MKMAAAAKKRVDSYQQVNFTPTEINFLGKSLAKKLSQYFLYVNDTLELMDGKIVLSYLYNSENQRKYLIQGRNFTFDTYLIVSNDTGETAVSHERNKLVMKRELVQMTERLLKSCIDSVATIGTVSNIAPKKDIPKKEYISLRKYKTIAEEIKHNSEPLTDFSKDLMVTAEVTFDETPKKKQKPVAEYNIRVFSKEDVKDYKSKVEKDGNTIISKIIKFIVKATIIPGAIYAIYTLIRHYIIK